MNEDRTRIYVDGKSLKEISEESGVSIDTVRHRYSRGLRTYEELASDEGLHNNNFRLEIATAPGRRFLKAADDKNITLSTLSKRTGISRSTIWNFMCNSGDISSKRLASLCDAVGVSMDYVMGLKRG